MEKSTPNSSKNQTNYSRCDNDKAPYNLHENL